MKCSNPLKCNGEMRTYKGLPKNLLECAKCGFRTDAPKVSTAKQPKAEILPTLSTENKETK